MTYYFAMVHISLFFALLSTVSFVALANIRISIPDKYRKHAIIVLLSVSAAVILLLSQLLLGVGISDVAGKSLLVNYFICLFFILLFFFATRRLFAGIVSGTAILLTFTTIDYLVYMFRGNELSPYDFQGIGTAINVAKEYVFPFTKNFIMAYTLMALFIVLLSGFTPLRINRKKQLMKFGISVSVIIISVLLISNTISSKRWSIDGAKYIGVYANFFYELRESRIKAPEGYNAKELEMSLSKYERINTKAAEKPNIIVIMNESFAELQQLNNPFETNKPVTPFLDSLEEDTVKGYAYASVFGGSTSCSEYEFLTGNTMAFFPKGIIPYQLVKENTYSIVSVLKGLGYKCEAFHPFYSSGWNRQSVYPKLGFEEYFFLDAFSYEEEGLIRGFVSDKTLYEMMMNRFENRDKRTPLFMFCVTIQNHGGYEIEEYYPSITIKEHEGEYPEAEQYLSLINQSDSAFEYLIGCLKEEEDPTIVVFFGDHMPNLSSDFYTFAQGESKEDGSLDYNMERLRVPFIIWANFDIEEKEVEKTSLNYLAGYLYDVAGVETAYYSVLEDIENVIPLVNSNGYYSVSKNKYKVVEEAEGKEKEALDMYRKLQYNNLFDKRNRLSLFE